MTARYVCGLFQTAADFTISHAVMASRQLHGICQGMWLQLPVEINQFIWLQ